MRNCKQVTLILRVRRTSSGAVRSYQRAQTELLFTTATMMGTTNVSTQNDNQTEHARRPFVLSGGAGAAPVSAARLLR